MENVFAMENVFGKMFLQWKMFLKWNGKCFWKNVFAMENVFEMEWKMFLLPWKMLPNGKYFCNGMLTGFFEGSSSLKTVVSSTTCL